MDSHEHGDGLPMPQRVFSIITVSMGVTLAVMDTTIVNVALPTMAKALELTNSDSIWIVNSYQVAIIMFLLSMSTAGEIYSYKRVYQCGMALFTLSSLVCGMASDLSMLVIGRIFQGIGASAMMAINMTLLRLSYPKRYLGKGIGLNATLVALAMVIGPTLAALILAVSNWRWLFFINIPLGVAGLFLGWRSLPQNKVHLSDRIFPYRDAMMNALFFGTFILALEGISHGFSVSLVSTFAIVSVITGFFYIRRQLSLPYPLLPIDLLKIRLFSVSVVTSIASFTAQMLAMVALPFYFQHILMLSETETGVLFAAWPATIMFSAPLAGSLIGKVHAGILGGIGLLCMSMGLFALFLLPTEPTHVDIIWRLMLCGFGFGLFQSPNNNILITSAPHSRSGSASGMLAMARLNGQTLGATLVALFFILVGDTGSQLSLLVASAVAFLACLLSLLRLRIK